MHNRFTYSSSSMLTGNVDMEVELVCGVCAVIECGWIGSFCLEYRI